MVTVVASVGLAPGSTAEFLRMFETCAESVRGEKGCLDDLPYVDRAAHLEATAMRECKERVAGILEGLSLRVLQEA